MFSNPYTHKGNEIINLSKHVFTCSIIYKYWIVLKEIKTKDMRFPICIEIVFNQSGSMWGW